MNKTKQECSDASNGTTVEDIAADGSDHIATSILATATNNLAPDNGSIKAKLMTAETGSQNVASEELTRKPEKVTDTNTFMNGIEHEVPAVETKETKEISSDKGVVVENDANNLPVEENGTLNGENSKNNEEEIKDISEETTHSIPTAKEDQLTDEGQVVENGIETVDSKKSNQIDALDDKQSTTSVTNSVKDESENEVSAQIKPENEDTGINQTNLEADNNTEMPIKEPDKNCDMAEEEVKIEIDAKTNNEKNECINVCESQENSTTSNSDSVTIINEPMDTNECENTKQSDEKDTNSAEVDSCLSMPSNSFENTESVESNEKVHGELSEQTDSSTGPPSLTKEVISDDNSVSSDLNRNEEPMDLGEQVPNISGSVIENKVCAQDNKCQNDTLKSGVDNDSVNCAETVASEINIAKVDTVTASTTASLTAGMAVTGGETITESKSACEKDTTTVITSASTSFQVKKGQKLDQLLSKISTKAGLEDQKTSSMPRQAKARKSCATASNNSNPTPTHTVPKQASHSKGIAGLTFNVKELEKTGVLDIPKVSKRKAFEPIKIPSPDKSQIRDNMSPDRSVVRSPVELPIKTENSDVKKGFKGTRRKKGKKMGAYRLPGEKKKINKNRKAESEERETNKEKHEKPRAKSETKQTDSKASLGVTSYDSDGNQNNDGNKTDTKASDFLNSLQLTPKKSLPSATKISTSVLETVSKTSATSLGSAACVMDAVTASTQLPTVVDSVSYTSLDTQGNVNAFNMITKNSQKSFTSTPNSTYKKAKKSVRQGIDPATHRTLESFLMAGSHSQQIVSANKKSSDKGIKVEDTVSETAPPKSDHRKRKASDPHKIVQANSPESMMVTPEEKKRRMEGERSPQPIPQTQQMITLLPTGSPPLSMPMNMVSAAHPVMPVTGTGASPILLTQSTGGPQTIIQNGTLNGLPMFQILNNQNVTTAQAAQFVAFAQPPGRSLLNNFPKSPPTLVTNKGVPVLLAPVQFPTSVSTVSAAQPHLFASPGKIMTSIQSTMIGNQQVQVATATTHSMVQQQHSVLKQTLNSKSNLQLPNGKVVEPPTSKHISKDGSSVPNGMYPVTPPRTPEEQRSESGSQDTGEEMETSASGSVPQDKDVLPLCTCKISGASFQKMSSSVTFCQALDSVDGKVLGCCNKVTNPQLVRPAVKIPFLAVCEPHRKRLRLHQCCPGCGHFCTQGRFLQCTKENSNFVHHFHEQCQFSRNGNNHCPHCGELSLEKEVHLVMPENKTAVSKEKTHRTQTKARIGLAERRSASAETDHTEDTGLSHTLEKTKKVISSYDLPLGPDRYSLERVLSTLSNERPKKYRHLPKCLYTPAYDNDLERVIYMLEDGHNPNEGYEDLDGHSALHAAATIGSLCIVHVLVQAGASPHLQDKYLKTPLMFAAENNHPDVVCYLIKANAIIDAKADDGMTALHYAAKAGHLNIINLLLDTDRLNIDVNDDGGWTPLIWAAEHMEVEAVKLLLKRNSDPNLRDTEENTTMHWAAFSGSVSIAEQLLAAGCDLDSLNMHGDRPLHIAARQDHYECVVLFLARGADVEAKNNKGESPLECCLDQTSPVYLALKVNKQLKSFGAKHMGRPEKLLHRDLSKGRENIPIPCVNGVDDGGIPTDYLYVTDNIETTCLKINRVIGSLQTCQCKDDCSSIYCACGKNSLRCWYDKYGRLLPEFNMQEPPLIFECNRACECWTTCNNRVVQNGVMSRLQVFKTQGRGWGCKTLVDISRGTFICEYIGEHISDSEADRREDDSYLFDLDNKDGETYCIDARRYGNVARFINHLCEPNLVPVKVFVDSQDLRFPRICLFASRDIKAQEELGFDYGEKFWIIKWKQFTCTCGSQKCRYSTDTIQKTLTEYRQRHELDADDATE